MRPQVIRSKNSCTYYVAKSFRTLEGKYSSKVAEKLGSFEDLVERFGQEIWSGRSGRSGQSREVTFILPRIS